MKRVPIKEALTGVATGTEITVAGWVRTVRTSKGGFSFITLNDGSSLACIQVVADEQLPNYRSEVVHLSAGCSVAVTGQLVPSQGRGQTVELRASEVQVIGRADPERYPIQPKRHSFEFLRKQAHLRPRTNTFGAVARVRNTICAAIHEFFQSRGFLYVHTPIITPSDCEGAGQLFRVTTLEPGRGDEQEDFFGRRTNLTVSGQLELEAYACALGNVYSFGPTFRAENSNTPRHLAEFWMVEPEMAFCDLQGDAALAEEFLKSIFRAVLERCAEDMAFFNQRIDSTVIETLTGIVSSEFVHLSYTEAIEILQRAQRRWEYPPTWGAELQTEHERFLTEQSFKRPVIVTDFPASIKPFYMRLNDSPPPQGPTVAAMDVLVPKVGEIIGGSQREERLEVLTERMRGAGIDPEAYWWYLDLRRYGTVPHAGFGLGLERTVQFATGMANIRDVIPFPRTPRSAEF
ncbi:MAG: asparagine--tRNA ligase [Planctomycetales bacterium 4484_123]|nr:MAG: asparagine--tRNA ligase [Planctomycetales bacterium 4484_123]